MSFFDPVYASPTGSPQSMMDILISSLLFAFFGVMIFVGATRYEMTYDKKVKWWPTCFIPLGLAVIFGIQKVAFLQSTFYWNTVWTKKVIWSHYLALIIPVLCIAGIFLYRFLKKRSLDQRVY